MNRLLTLVLILLALVPGRADAASSAHSGHTQASAGSAVGQPWSSPATWPGGRVPRAGETVTIPAGQSVVLDVTPPRLAGVTVQGRLSFADRDLGLSADWIMIHGGTLEVGREDRPFTRRATLTLTDAKPGENVMGMGDKLIGVMGGGRLELHGQPRLPWTRLAATARVGSASLRLAQAPDWRPGDRITVASTDFDAAQQETVTVRSVAGAVVTLRETLKFSHFGERQTYGGQAVDERAEVGLLTRNVTVRGDMSRGPAGFGGQIMAMDRSVVRVENTELTQMGQAGLVRRYPLHFHMLGSARSSYVRGSSLHTLYNRCLTLHGTNDVTVDRNVMSGTVGHCLFLEDGAETGNVITGNLVLGTRSADRAKGEKAVLPSDADHPGAASYWISNPANVLRGNVAAGGDGVGFWYALAERPTGLSRAAPLWPGRTPLGTFENNVAHSYVTAGLNVDHAPQANGAVEPTDYRPLRDPGNEKSAPAPAVFDRFTAYKNRWHGAWFRGFHQVLRGAVLADNAIGVTFASSENAMEGGLVVGETANVGSAPSWEKRGPGGRSLPLPQRAGFPIRGFEFYDGEVRARGVTFANFVPSALRQAGALGYRRQNAYPLNPGNAAEDLRFLDANRVYLEAPQADGDKSAAFLDLSGSVTGEPGRYVVASSPLLFDASCTRRPEWNAYVCDKPYGRLWLDDVSGGGLGPVTLRRSDGASVVLTGTPGATLFSTTAPARTGYAAALTRGLPRHLRLGMNGRRAGDWVRLSLPAAAEPVIYRDWWIDPRSRLRRVALRDLDRTGGEAYAWEGGTLHLKLTVQPGRDNAVLDLCRTALCQ